MNKEQITAAAHVFEKNKGMELSKYDMDIISASGFTDKSSEELAREIVIFLDSSSDLEP